MYFKNNLFYLLLLFMIISCSPKQETLVVEVYETSASGNKLTKLESFSSDNVDDEIVDCHWRSDDEIKICFLFPSLKAEHNNDDFRRQTTFRITVRPDIFAVASIRMSC